jgi:preprotein translocase SecE subunit
MDDSPRDDASQRTFGVYKWGQGYWVRMMTAALLGATFMAAAAWLVSELGAVRLPMPHWSLPVSTATGTITPGQTVTLQRVTEGVARPIGTATVDSYAGSGSDAGSLIVSNIVVTDATAQPIDTNRIEVAGATGAPASFAGSVTNAHGIPIFEPIYLQAGVVVLVLLVGMFTIYHFVGSSPKPVDFLIATDGEMKKVNWSTRKIIKDSTTVVIAATFLIAAVIFVFDYALSFVMQQVGILQG